MGLLILLFGLAVFLGVHVFVTFRAKRTELIARWGEGPYKLGFSLIAVIGLVLIVYGFGLYRATAWVDLWSPPRWTRHIGALLMWPATVLLFAAYLPGHIKRAAKHPMLVAVKLWALAHLIANGDLGSVLLFGSFLAWAVYDRVSVKRRERGGEVVTAPVVGNWRNDAIAIGIGTIIYLALGFAFHPVMIGVPALGG